MLHVRLAVCVLPLLTAACSIESPRDSHPDTASPDSGLHEICTIGPGPSTEAVVALGSELAPFDGARIQVCRNGGSCGEATFVPPPTPIHVDTGIAASFPAHDDFFLTAVIWNEGGDGYVLDVKYLAEVPPPTDGDTYSVTLTSADASTPIVSLAGTAAYIHVDDCAGGYPYFRMGVPCLEQGTPPECVSDWDPVECRCRAPLAATPPPDKE